MKKKYDIAEILKGCLNKQPLYQRALVDQYSGLLFVICKRYMRDDIYAKDLVQESLMKIFKHLDKYDKQKGSFESWISTISIRTCLKKLAKKKIALVAIDETHDKKLSAAKTSKVLDNLDTEYLVKMVQELPDGYREVFNLAVIDGYAHVDIGKQLSISEETSRTRLSRAKGMLRKKIISLNNQELWVNSI